MAGKQKQRSTIGRRSRLTHRKMVKLTDAETGEFLANVRWRRCGQVFIEPAKHVKPRVVPDPNS